MEKLIRIFPGLAWYQDYTREIFKRDLFSGITIAAMLIPQGMGYALVAGLPAEYGLYACIIPPIIYALLGTSNKLSIGPVALDSILILSGLSLIAEPGSDNYLVLAVTLTLMVGVIQLCLGLLKFGFIANFLSYPVILGYTSAASIIIIGSQLENVLGVDVGVGNVFSLVSRYAQKISFWHWPTLAISVMGLLFLIYPKRWLPRLPCGLILIISGMFASGLWNAQGYGISVIDYVPQGLPVVVAPNFSWEIVKQLIPTALTVALMGYVGSMSICKAQEKPSDKLHVRPNQELIAVGAANLAGAFFKAFPVSASFSRSASFVEAGAMTQASAVISSIAIVLILIFLTPAFAHYPLPKSMLAVIIITSVYGLFKHKDMKALYYQNHHEFIIAMLTFLSTLLLGVQQGLIVGVVLSIGRVLYNTVAPHMTELGAMQGGKLYRNVDRFQEVKVRRDVLIFRFDAPLYFANKDYFTEKLYGWIAQREAGDLKVVIFDAEAVATVDTTAIRMLQKVIDNLKQQNVDLYITNAIGPVRDELMKSPLKKYFDMETMFPTIQDAICFIDEGVCADRGVSLQTNAKA